MLSDRILPQQASGDERCANCPNPDEEGCPPGAITEGCGLKVDPITAYYRDKQQTGQPPPVPR